MADKFNLGDEVRELKIGQSFTNQKAVAFHTIRYDFKPASVDVNKSATIDVANTNQVTLTVPHLDGAGVPHTIFKGSQKPFQKECVLIIDKITGEITLEKLTGNIQVKKTRNELPKINHNDRSTTSTNPTITNHQHQHNTNNVPQPHPAVNPSINTATLSASQTAAALARAQTPPIGQRQSNKTRVTSGRSRVGADRHMIHMVPRHSPLHASPNPGYAHLAPGSGGGGGGEGRGGSPRRGGGGGDGRGDREQDTHNPSSLASLPMIGMDDFSTAAPTKSTAPALPSFAPNPSSSSNVHSATALAVLSEMSTIGEISDSSSSSSSSDSEEEESDKDEPTVNKRPMHTPPTMPSWSNAANNSHSSTTNGMSSHSKTTVPNAHILNQDLDLSESGSESD